MQVNAVLVRNAILGEIEKYIDTSVAFAWLYGRSGAMWLNQEGLNAQVDDWAHKKNVCADAADNCQVKIAGRTFYVALVRPVDPHITMELDPIMETFQKKGVHAMAYLFKDETLRDEVVKKLEINII